MLMAMPVASYPVPSYLDIIKDSQNAFLFTNKEDLKNVLNSMRDEKVRKSIGESARKDSVFEYSIDNIGKNEKKY